MKNDNILPNGTITYAMECGCALEVVITGSSHGNSWMGAEYDCVYIGTKKVCLDIGQNWFAEKGMKFKAHQCHLDRAAELKVMG